MLKQRLALCKPLFSVEFFPPKSEEAAKQLLETAAQIKAYNPDFVSITYGAGGSTRNRTLSYARKLQEDYNYTVMPHLTCVGHSRDELKQIIGDFKDAGIGQIMALRGDPPQNQENFIPHPDGLKYANQLVELIQKEYPGCEIGVGGYPEKHPEAVSLEADLTNLKKKVDAGATFITTQLFFDNLVYFKFLEMCRSRDIQVPVLPGIMSATSLQQVQRFCKMCGASIPKKLEQQLLDAGNDKHAAQAIGADWCYQQVKELLEKGVPGIHFYILNRSGTLISLMERLKVEGLHYLAE